MALTFTVTVCRTKEKGAYLFQSKTWEKKEIGTSSWDHQTIVNDADDRYGLGNSYRTQGDYCDHLEAPLHVLTTLIIQRLPCFVSGFLKRVFIKMFSIVFLCSCLAFLLKQMEQSLSSEGKSPLHFSINSTSIKPHWIPHAQVSFASQCEYFSPIYWKSYEMLNSDLNFDGILV